MLVVATKNVEGLLRGQVYDLGEEHALRLLRHGAVKLCDKATLYEKAETAALRRGGVREDPDRGRALAGLGNEVAPHPHRTKQDVVHRGQTRKP